MADKIKVKVFRFVHDYDYDTNDYKHLADNWTEWEEIDKDFLYQLERWANNQGSYDTYRYGVVSPVDNAVPLAIKDIKKEVERTRKAEQKRKEAAAKRKATIAKNKLEKEKAEFERLQKKFK
jgi:hypothetical protein